MDKYSIEEYFGDVEVETSYNGYFYSVSDAIGIAILGTFCGLVNMKKIVLWAKSERIRAFLKDQFSIYEVPCYSWFTQILGNVKPESFNECFVKWIMALLGDISGGTLSFDGKTVCSTAKMKNYKNPLHIVNAQLAEFGITIGQKTVDGKSNEIPAVRELLDLLDVNGCMIVADALNCQKETVNKIRECGADYLLPVKGNHSNLEADISDFVADDELRATMDTETTTEKNRDRIETRTAYTTFDINWLYGRENWRDLVCIGAINRKVESPKGTSDEWHFYISSKKLTAQQLLDYARKEWSVETMHYLLDVHFSEDSCRAAEQRTQENLNIIRKIVLNLLRIYKNKNNCKSPFSTLLFDCLLEPYAILKFFQSN
jgi:predicted transposase YbfD/YdcC